MVKNSASSIEERDSVRAEKLNDSVLKATKCLLDAKEHLNPGQRTQLNKSQLTFIRALLQKALSLIFSVEGSPIEGITLINSAIEYITAMLDDEDFVQTDWEEKSAISEKVISAIDYVCLFCGKYYTTKGEFEYTRNITSLIDTVIIYCIDRGYYFGLEKEVNKLEI